MKEDTTTSPPAMELEQQKPPPPRRRNMYAIACAILASMTSILLGYDVAVVSGAAKFLKHELNITDTQLEIFNGIINIYSVIGSLAAGRTSDCLGRRKTFILAAAIFFLGALLMAVAPNYPVIMIGRFVAGVGVGYALMIAPVYTAEVAPASSRGFLTSFPEVFINSGILVGYVVNFAFSGLPWNINWRLMFAVGAVPPVFLAAAVMVMPESPRWLVMQGRLGEARRVLTKTSDTPEEAEARLTEIKAAAGIAEDCNDEVVEVPKRNRGEGVWKELLITPTPTVRRILIAALGLQFFQQASGIDSIVIYGPSMFEKAGLTTNHQQLGATVAIGFSKTIFILVATFLLDRVGRRPLLLSSAGGMILSLLLLACSFLAIDRSDKPPLWAVALTIAMVLSFAGSFAIGLGPIAWVYSSEIFPLRLRAQGASLGTVMNRVMSGTITMTFISLHKAITFSGTFFLYAGIATAGWVFFYVFLPETRGKTLEETQELFAKKKDGEKLAKKGEVVNGAGVQ